MYSWTVTLQTARSHLHLSDVLAGFSSLGFTFSPYYVNQHVYRFKFIVNHSHVGAMMLWDIKYGPEWIRGEILIEQIIPDVLPQ